VLLVEDEAPVRAFASRALKMRGYTVLEAENAEEALKTLEDQSLNVDVFVTDVIMPGMDGPSWVAEALKQRPDVRVVFVSGYAEDSFSEQQARIPNSVFLPKPCRFTDIRRNRDAEYSANIRAPRPIFNVPENFTCCLNTSLTLACDSETGTIFLKCSPFDPTTPTRTRGEQNSGLVIPLQDC